MNLWKNANFLLLLLSRAAFAAIALSVPVITEYWESLGLEESGGYWLQVVFAIGLVILEVLTGKLADSWGRKPCLVLSGAVGVLGAFVYATGSSFRDLAFAEVLLALSSALSSGTEEALLYESLREEGGRSGEEHRVAFDQAIRLLFRVGFLAMVPWSMLSGFVYAVSPRLVWFIITGAYGVRLVCWSLVREPKREHVLTKPKHIQEAIDLLWNRRDLRALMVVSALIMSITQTAVWSYTPQFRSAGWSLVTVGLVFAGFHLVAGLGSTKKFLSVRSERNDFTSMLRTGALLALLSAFSFGFLVTAKGAFILLAVLPQQWTRGVLTWVFAGYFQERVPDEIRSTTASVRSAFRLLVYGVLLVVNAFLLEVGNRNVLLVANFVALLGLSVVLLGYLSLRNRCEPKEVVQID